MTELKRRFEGADRIPVPELWDQIRGRTPNHETRSRRGPAALVIALALAVAGITAGAVALTGQDRSTDEASEPSVSEAPDALGVSCAYNATFRGAEYLGRYPIVQPVPGKSLGVATVPPCDGGEPGQLEVAQLDEVDPAIAVVSVDAEILLIAVAVEQVPPEVSRYLAPPSCNVRDEPIELFGTWLGILGADGNTEADLLTPYDIFLRVDEASSPRYERAELTVRVPGWLGKPLSRADLEASLSEGGDIRVVAECADGGYVAREVEAFPG